MTAATNVDRSQLVPLAPVLAPLSLSRIVWLTLLVIFALAYVAAALVFGIMYQNIWAVVGYAYTALLICVRIGFLVCTKQYLLTIFPPRSAARFAYQIGFVCSAIVGLALFLYMFALGLVRYQRWDGKSYFSAMIGWNMASRWSCFVTIPMYQLRWDVVYPDVVYRLGDFDADDDSAYYDAQLNAQKILDSE